MDECNKLTYVDKTGLISISDLTIEDKGLLLWWCGIQQIDSVTALSSVLVCFHHHKVYLEKCEFLQRSCCDPFNVHKKTNKGSLRVVDILIARKVKLLSGKSIKPGQKICPRCITAVSKVDSDLPEGSAEHDEEYYPTQKFIRENAHESINKSFSALGCSPLKEQVGVHEAKRKLSQGQCQLTEHMGKYLKVSADKLIEAPPPCVKCTDLNKILCDLKAKCAVSSRQKQIAILTLVPSSWCIRRTSEEFNVSKYKVKQARGLVRCCGILSEPAQKKANSFLKIQLNWCMSFMKTMALSWKEGLHFL